MKNCQPSEERHEKQRKSALRYGKSEIGKAKRRIRERTYRNKYKYAILELFNNKCVNCNWIKRFENDEH